MALYVTSFDAPSGIEDAFDYLADFSNTARWDPSVSRAVRCNGGEVGPGSRFEVDVSFLGATTTMMYEITRWERPCLVVLEAKTPFVFSHDEISLVPSGAGVHVTYAARLTLTGILRIADPALQLAFDASGDRSRDGLIEGLRGLGGRPPR